MNQLKKHKKVIIRILSTLALCVLIISCLCVMYLQYLQNMVKKESRDYLKEVSSQASINVKNMIGINISVLKTIASVLDNDELKTMDNARHKLYEQQAYWDYSKISLIDENGTWYHCNGGQDYLSLPEYLPKVIIDKQSIITSAQMIDGQEAIIFAIPLFDTKIDNINIVALAATYNLDTLDEVLSLDLFNGNGYSYVINTDGSLVARSNHKDAIISGYNLLTILKDTNIYEQVKSDIATGKNGFAEYTLNGIKKYMNYAPVGVQDWYLLTVVPKAVVNTKSDMLFATSVVICGGIILVFTTIMLLMLLSRLKSRKRLEYLAYVDPITGGYNKRKFEEAAEIKIQQSQENLALLYTNLERFKLINDRFGRFTGDALLKSLYELLANELNSGELLGRLTADNFGMLLHFSTTEELESRITIISNKVQEVTDANDNIYGLNISFGVYFPTEFDSDIITMLDRANLARKQLLPSSKIRYSIYEDRIKQRMQREKTLENKMHKALDEKHFQVYLQPKIELCTGSIGGAEALVRWKDPEEGMIFPSDFIPLFERNGFIVTLDLYVFHQVCNTISRWINMDLEPIAISVNLSRANLYDPKFLNAYYEIMKKYNVPGKYIEFEFTETMAYEHMNKLQSLIEDIHNMGCTCSMDDFGSGYSSLNMLKSVRVDVLKLDREFFTMEEGDERSMEVIEGIVDLAKRLRLSTVSEGIETMSQVDFLKRIGCDYVQGFVFAKPMPIIDFEHKAYGKFLSEI